MPWGELVHVEARYFAQGDYPWTERDFFCHSVLQCKAAHTVNPIVLTLWKHQGPRVAEDDGWWIPLGDVWWSAASEDIVCSTDLAWRLDADAVRFQLTALQTGSSSNDDAIGLLRYEIDGMGKHDVFAGYVRDLKAAADQVRGDNAICVQFVTLWHCDAGKDPDTWVGLGEYWTSWELIGVVLPEQHGVRFLPIVHPEAV